MRTPVQRMAAFDPHLRAPPFRARPELAHWLLDHDLELRAAGALFGCSHSLVAIICKPFDDELRRPPRLDLLERIVDKTNGEITGEHFIPPHLRQRPANGDQRVGDPDTLRMARAS